MMTLADLAASVRLAIANGRIGQPVATRLHAWLSADHGRLIADAAVLAALAADWLAAPPRRFEARGSADAGHLTLLIDGSAGETLLIHLALLLDGPPRLDLSLLGTQGSLRHEGFANAVSEPIALPTHPADDPWRVAIQQSLDGGGMIAAPANR